MPANFAVTSVDLIRFSPEIILTVVGTLLMVLDPVLHRRSSHAFGHISLLALVAALGAAIYAYGQPGSSFSDMLIVDGFATFFRVLVMVVGILTVLSSYRFLDREDAETGEYHALLLFSITGQSLMAASNDLLMIFIGLEISSIASYVMAGYLRDDKRANEAALKYFLLGSFATAFFLYGVALTYGATGHINLTEVRQFIITEAPSPVLIGLAAALMFVGLGFKVSASPFQMWAPDVYQGAPTPVAAFLSAGPKAAAFAIFLRIFTTAFEPISAPWQPLVFGVSALLSMTIGNFAALLQSNVKRMLAYSSIANAGYIMVALTARSDTGTSAAMFYLAAYAFMNVGAFAVVAHLSGKGERYQTLDDFAGLGQKQPLTAAMLTIFMLSLIGVPLTGGFFGKFYIFKAALESKLVWLAVFGLLTSAVAAFYYLRVLVMMYMHEPSKASIEAEPLPLGLGTALMIPAAATLFLGIFPGWVLDFASRSAALVK
ncbi:MAG TPA: NADH-quinone oxidoreductase subunit N [Bryobacteraceae bacterium]|nr:NADH-quinone oxidoreductase subunit N [Bryobacteraceae bacterium]